jgi:hypothetical protein
VNTNGLHSVANFEVIDIMDDSQPYPTLMGLEWEFDNRAIINLKKREMIFEVRDLKITERLDPIEGKIYIDPTRGNNMDNLYNMIAWMDDYVNHVADGALSWRSISSFASNLKEGLENWQQRMNKVSTKRCAHCWHRGKPKVQRLTAHQKNPDYQPFQQHLRGRRSLTRGRSRGGYRTQVSVTKMGHRSVIITLRRVIC